MQPSTVTMTRRAFGKSAACVAASTGLATACGKGTDAQSSLAEVTYLTSFGQLGRDAYAYVAQDRGYFAEANLSVTIEPGSGSNPNLQALLGGQAQFAAFDLSGAVIARDAGADGFVAIAAVQQLPLAALMSIDPGVRRPADVAGKRVGLPAGAVTELLFPTWAELAGVDVSRVEQVPLGPTELVPALAAGQVDVIGQFVVGKPLVAAATGVEPTVLPYSDVLTDLYGIGLHTTTELVADDPQLCLRFRDALLNGLAYALANPAEAGEILHQHNPSADPEVAGEEMRLMYPWAWVPAGELGEIDPDRLARSVALLQSAGAITGWVEPEELVAFDLTPGAVPA